MPDGKVDQQAYRTTVKAVDQFGRNWAYRIEKSTGGACSTIAPYGGWSDPLATPQKYLNTKGQLGKVKVELQQWVDDLKRADREWMENLYDIGRQLYQKATGPKEIKEWPQDHYLLRHAGEKPGEALLQCRKQVAKGEFVRLVKLDDDGEPLETPIEILQRAMSGDIELLGGEMSGAIPPEEDTPEPTDVSWPKFRAEAIRNGKTEEQASAAWAVHKASKELVEA